MESEKVFYVSLFADQIGVNWQNWTQGIFHFAEATTNIASLHSKVYKAKAYFEG